MGNSNCVFIPKGKNGEEADQLFVGIQNITKNREVTTALWALSKDSVLMSELGIPTERELSAVEYLSYIPNIDKILDSEGYAKFVSSIEKSHREYDTYSEAIKEGKKISEKYSNIIPLVNVNSNGSYSVIIAEDNTDNRIKLEKQNALNTLNSKLIGYVNKLGFDVKETEELEEYGMFSPVNAEENAKGLKEAIKIAKGEKGQEILPEEISHLLIEGSQNNPLVQRMLSTLSNKELLQEILGKDYEAYYSKYKGDVELMAKEAAGRILAQHLADRAGLASSISYISNRAFNAINKNLAKGEENNLDILIKQLYIDTTSIVDKIEKDEVLEYFNSNLVNDASTLYNLSEEVTKMHEITKKSYELMAKRLKLKSLKDAEGKIDALDMLSFKTVKQAYEKEKYSAGCLGFLEFVLKDVKTVYANLNKIKISSSTQLENPKTVKFLFSQLKDVDTIKKAYTEAVGRLASLSADPNLQEELSEALLEKIENIAQQVSIELNTLDRTHKVLRDEALYLFYKMYWPHDIEATVAGQRKTITLKDVLQSCPFGDINGFSRIVNSMADSSDPLLQLVYTVTKDAFNARDIEINKLQQKIVEIQTKYTEQTGSRDVSFMFVKNSMGKPTGMLLSEIDYSAYYKAKHAKLEELKAAGYDQEKIHTKLKSWENKNTEKVEIKNKKGEVLRSEKMPRKDLYRSRDLDFLSPAQRDYYDEMIEIKKELDRRIPAKNARMFRAPMIEMDSKEALLTGKSKITGIFKSSLRSYINKSDDTAYGETIMENGVYKVLDFNDNEVKKVPVYYTTFLDDMSLLNMNLSETLLSYGAMAHNYSATNTIADVLEVTKSFYAERPVIKTSGGKQQYERFKLGDEAITKVHTVEGKMTNNYKKLESFIDTTMYGQSRNKSNVTLGNVTIAVDKIGDKVMHLNAINSMGLNAFSATSNATMGMIQLLVEASGGEFFTIKELGQAVQQYFGMLPNNIIQSYKDNKTDKLSLLIKKFDVLESLFTDIKNSDINSNFIKKFLGRINPLIGNTMGEHALHAIGMLAILNNTKVLLNGKKISLYDALEIKQEEGIYDINFKEGVTSLDGGTVDNDYLFRVKQIIHNCNNRLQGAYNMIDKGDIHKITIGRLVAQFRQWMPALVMNRASGYKINLRTNKEEEGYYRTFLSFLFGSLKDLKNRKFNILTRFSELEDFRKANIRKASFELSVLAVLSIILSSSLGQPDEEDPWIANLSKYNLYRLRMEIASLSPTPAFFSNIETLTRQPIPSIGVLETVIDVLDIFNMEIIESGRYKGWLTNVKALYQLTPTVKNVDKLIRFTEGEMDVFKPYTS